ncbi:hypothetical protein Lser_V15G23303 [Lactuca serriola]
MELKPQAKACSTHPTYYVDFIRSANYPNGKSKVEDVHLNSCVKGVHSSHSPNNDKLSLDSFKTPIRPVDCNANPLVTPVRQHTCYNLQDFSTNNDKLSLEVTSTMVGRVLMLLHKGFEASDVLVMKFTTTAASEMRDRIGAVAGKITPKELMINTFHSFSLQLCRLHADKHVGRTPEFLVYGQGQQRKVVTEAVRLSESGNKIQISDSDDKLCEESSITRLRKWLRG